MTITPFTAWHWQWHTGLSHWVRVTGNLRCSLDGALEAGAAGFIGLGPHSLMILLCNYPAVVSYLWPAFKRVIFLVQVVVRGRLSREKSRTNLGNWFSNSEYLIECPCRRRHIEFSPISTPLSGNLTSYRTACSLIIFRAWTNKQYLFVGNLAQPVHAQVHFVYIEGNTVPKR